MTTSTPSITHPIARQHRLQTIVKRLVIELGYLESCLIEGLQDDNVQTAIVSLDTAIDCLNEHLSV